MQLRTKIFLLTATVVVATLLLTTVVVRRQMDAAILADAEEDLAATQAAIDDLAEDRRRQREAQVRLLAQVASGDPRDLARRAEELFPSLGETDLLAVVGVDGEPLGAAGPAKTHYLASRPSAQDVPPLALALASPGADSPPANGLWKLGRHLYEVAAVPIGRPAAGAVLLATRVDNGVTERLCGITHSKVVILADGDVVASCLEAALTEVVVDRFPELAAASPPRQIGPRRISVGDQSHLARMISLDVDYGGLRSNHLILRSLPEPLTLTQGIGQRLVGIGLLALLGAFLLAWLGARHIAGPLRRLAEAMSRIARSGRLEQPREDPRSSREVALFQEAFHRMLDSIEESQQERESSYIEAVEAVMAAIDHRDRESAGHSYRVGRYAVLLAQRLGLSGPELQAVEWGALLHDVGKIAVPDAILRKEGPLDDSEWRVMRRHPEWGHAILEDVRFLHPALDVVRHHHERWDGNGYPRGLRQEEIPLAARIFSVVDTYDAITSDRYYRAARNHEEALAELRRVAGEQLDPRIVGAFLDLPEIQLAEIRSQTHRVSHVLEETRQLAWKISVGQA